MSQKTNVTFRVSGDESTPQGTSPSLEHYLSGEDTITDRLQKGPPTAPLDRLLQLKDQLDRLSGIVTNGQHDGSQAQRGN